MDHPATVASGVPKLFVDNVMVAVMRGLVRTLHSGRKLPQPVLVPDRPWEGSRGYVSP